MFSSANLSKKPREPPVWRWYSRRVIRLASEATSVPEPPILTPRQQFTEVVRELGEQDRRGYVAYDLAGKLRGKQSAFVKHRGKKIPHRRYARHVAGKDEEREKSREQRVIELPEHLPVEYQQRRGDDGCPGQIRNSAEYHRNGECEQREINDPAPPV